jgi:hypothetical protein
MAMLRLKTLAALLTLPLLAACAPEIESSVYVQDVVTVVQQDQAISVPAILRIPQGSEDECKKGLDDLIKKLSAIAPTTGKGKCIEKSNNNTTDQLAEIETQMVIATPDAAFDAKNLFLLEVKPTANPGEVDLTFRLLKPIDEIVAALASPDQMQAEFDPALFVFTLNNDGAGDIQYLPNHVFLDGEPGLPENGVLSLERRKAVEIKFSDVASAWAEKGNAYRFATITIDATE